MGNVFSMKKLEPVIREVLESGGTFKLIIHGTSMLPLLRDRRDAVILVQKRDLYPGDIPLVKLDEDTFILHRILAVDGQKLTLCGDNRYTAETADCAQVIGVVRAVVRDGKRFELTGVKYKMYCAMLPVRRKLKRIKNG